MVAATRRGKDEGSKSAQSLVLPKFLGLLPLVLNTPGPSADSHSLQCGQSRVADMHFPSPSAAGLLPWPTCLRSALSVLPGLSWPPFATCCLTFLPLAQENISRKIYFCINVNKVSVLSVQMQTGHLHISVCCASRLQPQPSLSQPGLWMQSDRRH